MKSILFVCLGNICRSPLAEGIALKIVQDSNLDIVIDSAGTGHWHVGNPPCENSIKVASNHGINIANLRARKVSPEDKKNFHYIVAMDEINYQDLEAMGFENLYKIGDFGGFDGECVPDPYYYDGFEGFEVVYNMLDICIKDFLETKGLLR